MFAATHSLHNVVLLACSAVPHFPGSFASSFVWHAVEQSLLESVSFHRAVCVSWSGRGMSAFQRAAQVHSGCGVTDMVMQFAKEAVRGHSKATHCLMESA